MTLTDPNEVPKLVKEIMDKFDLSRGEAVSTVAAWMDERETPAELKMIETAFKSI